MREEDAQARKLERVEALQGRELALASAEPDGDGRHAEEDCVTWKNKVSSRRAEGNEARGRTGLGVVLEELLPARGEVPVSEGDAEPRRLRVKRGRTAQS